MKCPLVNSLLAVRLRLALLVGNAAICIDRGDNAGREREDRARLDEQHDHALIDFEFNHKHLR